MKIIILTILSFVSFVNIIYAQWIQQPTGVSNYLRDIDFINSRTGWVCGDGGTILKTTNGGNNWISQFTGVTNKPLSSIHPVDSNVVYCVGWFETILKTTNGGNNWVIIENAPFGKGRSYESCFFIDENTGWVSSSSQIMKKTTNGGNSFVNYSNVVISRDLYFKDHFNGLGVSEVTYISKTSDGGENWSSYSIAGTGNLYRLSILKDGLTGFTVAYGSQIVYKTSNYGVSWDSVGIVPNLTVICSNFSSENIGWAGTNRDIGNAQLFKTTNGGKNWTAQNSNNTRSYNDIFALNDSLVWTCGGFGTIFHTKTGGDTVVNISQISSTVPENFQLNQNYPNPFNSSTKIKFNIKERDKYKLEIINTLGQSVREIINQDISPGSYEFMFDAYTLNSGVYFIRLSNHKYFKTIKTMLIK